MNSLLEQFLSESREALQQIGIKLMQLEKEPASGELITELFRLVHTLKGNSGLFDYPELTRVLHAGEDLMDAVRCGKVVYSLEMADRLLDAMDFVGLLCDEIETQEKIDPSRGNDSFRLAEMLRRLIGESEPGEEKDVPVPPGTASSPETKRQTAAQTHPAPDLSRVPEAVRMTSFRSAAEGNSLHLLCYRPAEDCFFQGEDPFFQARKTPGLVWGEIHPRESWAKLTELDAYRCLLDFTILSTASLEELNEFFRYVTEQVGIEEIPGEALIFPQGDPNGGPVYEDFIVDALRSLREGKLEVLNLSVQSMQELVNPALWIASVLRWIALVLELLGKEGGPFIEALLLSLRSFSPPDWHSIDHGRGQPVPIEQPEAPSAASVSSEIIDRIVGAQREILSLPDDVSWLAGSIQGISSALSGCLHALGRTDALASLASATESAVFNGTFAPLREWLNQIFPHRTDLSLKQDIDETSGGASPHFRSDVLPAQPKTSPAAAPAGS